MRPACGGGRALRRGGCQGTYLVLGALSVVEVEELSRAFDSISRAPSLAGGVASERGNPRGEAAGGQCVQLGSVGGTLPTTHLGRRVLDLEHLEDGGAIVRDGHVSDGIDEHLVEADRSEARLDLQRERRWRWEGARVRVVVVDGREVRDRDPAGWFELRRRCSVCGARRPWGGAAALRTDAALLWTLRALRALRALWALRRHVRCWQWPCRRSRSPCARPGPWCARHRSSRDPTWLKRVRYES